MSWQPVIESGGIKASSCEAHDRTKNVAPFVHPLCPLCISAWLWKSICKRIQLQFFCRLLGKRCQMHPYPGQVQAYKIPGFLERMLLCQGCYSETQHSKAQEALRDAAYLLIGYVRVANGFSGWLLQVAVAPNAVNVREKFTCQVRTLPYSWKRC